ncbi:hypothetical protein ES702_06698 [subsurface metagenome]
MEDRLYIFDPATNTCKSPLPEKFEQIIKLVTKEEYCIKIHGQEDLVDINSQLDRTLNLMICNVIQRSISQLIGRTLKGFVTLKGTDAGALHVYLTGSDPATPIDVRILAGTNLIGKIQIEGSSHEVKRAAIWQNTIASVQVIGLVATKKLCIVNITFTVDAEADISLNSNDVPITGIMDFGGTNEPKGFVANHGNFPLKTVAGEAFKIQSDTTARIAGYVMYYEE